MHADRFVYGTAGALVLGAALVLLFRPPFLFLPALVVLAVFLLAAGSRTKDPRAYLAAAMLAALVLGAMRADTVLREEAAETLPSYAGRTAQIVGRVVVDPDRRETSLHLIVQVSTVDTEQATGKLLVLAPRDAAVRYGDTVALDGELGAPEPFQTDTDHTFDYPGYLRAQGISLLMRRATLVQVTPGGFTILGSLYALKDSFEHSLERLYPEPDGSLEEGILLGEKGGIPQSMTDTFTKSGLVHVVVLSGYNIAVVSEAVFRTLAFLPKALGFGMGGTAMVFFALMTGAGSATMRALLMALIALFARYMHRSALALRSLALASAAMALWNPEGLLHDTSFILSVLATFGLITLSPFVEQRLPRFLSRYPSIRSIAASTISVQLFVLPALLYFSGVLSFLSVPANVLGLPVVPAAMLFGFLAGILGFIAPALGLLPAIISDLLLKWLLFVSSTIAAVPFGSAVVSQFSPWLLALSYLPLTWWALLRYKASSASSSKAF